MKLVPTEDERDLTQLFREVLRRSCPPELVRAQKDHPDQWPEALWNGLVDAGIFGIPDGEVETDSLSVVETLGLFAEQAGAVLCPPVVGSTLLCALALQELATDEVRQRLTADFSSGKTSMTHALWSPTDAHRPPPVISARPTDDGWLLDGSLPHVVAAGQAEHLLCLVSTQVIGEPAQQHLVQVPMAETGRSSTAVIDGHTWRVDLCGVEITHEQVWCHDVDPAGLRRLAHIALAFQAREMAGGCGEVLGRTVAYVSQREQFGRAIGTFQAVQHQVADMHIHTEAARLAAARATFWLARGGLAATEVAGATMTAGRAYPLVTMTAHQLHGGMGYVRETDLHLWSERAKMLQVRWGTPDVAAGWLEEELHLDD